MRQGEIPGLPPGMNEEQVGQDTLDFLRVMRKRDGNRDGYEIGRHNAKETAQVIVIDLDGLTGGPRIEEQESREREEDAYGSASQAAERFMQITSLGIEDCKIVQADDACNGQPAQPVERGEAGAAGGRNQVVEDAF